MSEEEVQQIIARLDAAADQLGRLEDTFCGAVDAFHALCRAHGLPDELHAVWRPSERLLALCAAGLGPVHQTINLNNESNRSLQ